MTDNPDIETSGTAQAVTAADPDEATGTVTSTTEETTMTPETSAEAATVAQAEDLVDVEILGKGLPAWKLAGVMRHQRWAPGKSVTRRVFDAALAAFEGRPLGGGR